MYRASNKGRVGVRLDVALRWGRSQKAGGGARAGADHPGQARTQNFGGADAWRLPGLLAGSQ